MLDAKLLAASIADREAYAMLAPHLTVEDFTPAGGFWWNLIREWYTRDRHCRRVDPDGLATLGDARVDAKQRATVVGYLRDLPESVSPANSAQIGLELKRHNVGTELAAAIAAGDEKKQMRLLPQFTALRAATSLGDLKKGRVKVEWAPPATELLQYVGQEARVPMAPYRLNSRIDGGLLPATHIVLFARPDMGKSTFSVNFSVAMAMKENKRVLYVSNEDSIKKLKTRAVCRVTDTPLKEAEKAWEATCQRFADMGGEDRIKFVRLDHGSLEDLPPLIDETEPDILVLDQLRNICGAEGEMVARLDENGQRVRELLNEYNLIGLSITQAGASAGERPWLGMEDLDNSKTGLPGAADLLIGMGADETLKQRNQRALSICKNKLSSEPNAKEGLIVTVNLSKSAMQ